jgi:hypothetical protein
MWQNALSEQKDKILSLLRLHSSHHTEINNLEQHTVKTATYLKKDQDKSSLEYNLLKEYISLFGIM